MKNSWIKIGVDRMNSINPATGSDSHFLSDRRPSAMNRPNVTAITMPTRVALIVTHMPSAIAGRISHTSSQSHLLRIYTLPRRVSTRRSARRNRRASTCAMTK